MFNKEQFVGREEVIALINKRLSDLKEGYRQNIALLGDEFIGKTWVTKFIFNDLSDSEIIPLYFDLSQPTVNIFAQRFLSILLFEFLKTKGIILSKEDLNKLIEESSRWIPNTTSKIQEILSNLKKNKLLDIAAFKDIFLLLEIFNQETGQKLVVILDEFQNLESLKIKNLFQELGKKIMTQKNAMYIISSSHKIKAKKIIQDELSLLFGNFEAMELNCFDNKTSGILIKDRIKNICIPQEVLNFLINFTGGHPFYLDKIARQIYQNALILGQNNITAPILISSLEDILFNKWGVLNLHFQNYIDILNSRNKPDVLNILLLIAQGRNRIKDLSVFLHKNYRDINQKLSRLIESNIISKVGSFYHINDLVFNFWLNFIYSEKMNNLSQNYEDQVASFNQKIKQLLSEFIEISKKDIAQRISDLFILFSNDSVQLGRKKILLSRFKEIKHLNLNCHFIKDGFLCISNEECWFVAFKNGDITEEDVGEFINESKMNQIKDIQTKRFIIGLDKTEVNAKLLAKEENITTWDISHLNTLLDLYGKPRLII